MRSTCPNCKEKYAVFVDYNSGQCVCSKCGFVTQNYVFSFEPLRDREGHIIGVGPLMYPWETIKLKTQVPRYRQAKTPQDAAKERLLRRIDRQTFLTAREKIINNLMREVKKIARNELVRVDNFTIREAERMASKIADKGLTRGRRIEETAAALLQIVCNKTGCIRVTSALAKAAGVDKNKLRKSIIFLEKRLGESFTSPPASSLIPSAVSLVLEANPLPPEIYSRVLEVSTRVCDKLCREGEFSGKNQMSVAVATILATIEVLTNNKFRLTEELLRLADAGEITVQRRIREIRPHVAQFVAKDKKGGNPR